MLSSVLKKEEPYRVSYYSACLPLLMQFSAVVANLMHALLGEFGRVEGPLNPTMTGEEMQDSVIQVSYAVCSIFRCQILPAQVKAQCCQLLGIALQNTALASVAMGRGDKTSEGKESIGSMLCDFLVSDMRSTSKHMKLGISSRRQSVVQMGKMAQVATLALRALLACSEGAKMAMVRNNYYRDLMMEFRVHSNAILAVSLRKKQDPVILKKSESRLMHIFVLLKHFSFQSKVCSDALAKEGVVELIGSQLEAYPKGSAQVQNGALGLLVNIVANSSTACLEVIDVTFSSKNRAPSFFLHILDIWESRKTLAPISRLCGYIVQGLLQIQESRTAILKTDFVGRMISLVERLLKKKNATKIGQTLKFLSETSQPSRTRVR